MTPVTMSLRYVLASLLSHSSLICSLVVLEHCVGIALCRVIHIWIVQQRLDTQNDLFDGDRRFPRFLLVQD